jgi:glycosyltransferase involved in cell wall biosynthesis
MRVLIVTLFFPPTGGGGVQRPLKFAAHLAALGHETVVLAPDDSKWIERDNTLPVPLGVRVIRARNLSPASRLLGLDLYGTRGLARLAVHARAAPRRLLIPDSSLPWNLTALPAALRLIAEARTDVVLTTSPPPSVHLVGAAAKRLTGVPWVADVRDSIVHNAHRRFDVRGERTVARLVARYADGMVAASEGIAAELRKLGPTGAVTVIESGCDFDEFRGLPHHRIDRMRVTHTGNFLGRRDPRPFCTALGNFDGDVVARFVGVFRPRDRDFAAALGLGDRLDLIPFVPRRESLALQRDSDVLLLLVPEAGGRGHHVLTGKVFEYLAAGRPILAAVPPAGEAARLIERAGAGIVVPPDDVHALAAAIETFRNRWRADALADVVLPPELETALTRRACVARMAEVLEEVARSPRVSRRPLVAAAR